MEKSSCLECKYCIRGATGLDPWVTISEDWSKCFYTKKLITDEYGEIINDKICNTFERGR